MGILFIAAANVLNVYAPALVGDGVDFLVTALKINNNNAQQHIEMPASLQWFRGVFGYNEHNIEITHDNFKQVVLKIGIYLSLGYIMMFLIKGVFLFYQRQTIIVMSRYIEYDLKNEIYKKYQDLDTSWYRRNRTGDIMNRISEDVTRVRMYIGPAVMYTINLVVLMIFCVFVMLKINRSLTFYTIAPLPFMMVGIFLVSRIINKRTDKVQARQSKLSSLMQEGMSGIRILKSFRLERWFIQTFSSENKLYKDDQMQLVKADALFMPVILLLVGVSTILTIYVGSLKVASGEITYGTIVQFVFYVNQLTWPFASVGWVSSLVQKAEASQARINEFLETESDLKNGRVLLKNEPLDIRFEHVKLHFSDSGITALDDIDLEIKEGEFVGITGRTGSGKSTFAQLLMRMMDPSSGRIVIQGTNLQDLNIKPFREIVGYVPQDVFLFSETIEENIAFGKKDASEAQIAAALRKSEMAATVEQFPDGLNTKLGERGINLSGGQKQRLTIARALIRQPKILLFDDCLSSVDTITEQRIIENIRKESVGKTVIFITHRIGAIQHADRIIVLDEGRIVENGNHRSLLMKQGLYARLYKQQSKNEKQTE
jgi:ATP-binding cassette subfamily B protein